MTGVYACLCEAVCDVTTVPSHLKQCHAIIHSGPAQVLVSSWMQDHPLDLSFWSFLTFLHHGIEKVERHLLWNFIKKFERKVGQMCHRSCLLTRSFYTKLYTKSAVSESSIALGRLNLTFFTAWTNFMKLGKTCSSCSISSWLSELFSTEGHAHDNSADSESVAGAPLATECARAFHFSFQKRSGKWAPSAGRSGCFFFLRLSKNCRFAFLAMYPASILLERFRSARHKAITFFAAHFSGELSLQEELACGPVMELLHRSCNWPKQRVFQRGLRAQASCAGSKVGAEKFAWACNPTRYDGYKLLPQIFLIFAWGLSYGLSKSKKRGKIITKLWKIITKSLAKN